MARRPRSLLKAAEGVYIDPVLRRAAEEEERRRREEASRVVPPRPPTEAEWAAQTQAPTSLVRTAPPVAVPSEPPPPIPAPRAGEGVVSPEGRDLRRLYLELEQLWPDQPPVERVRRFLMDYYGSDWERQAIAYRKAQQQAKAMRMFEPLIPEAFSEAAGKVPIIGPHVLRPGAETLRAFSSPFALETLPLMFVPGGATSTALKALLGGTLGLWAGEAAKAPLPEKVEVWSPIVGGLVGAALGPKAIPGAGAKEAAAPAEVGFPTKKQAKAVLSEPIPPTLMSNKPSYVVGELALHARSVEATDKFVAMKPRMSGPKALRYKAAVAYVRENINNLDLRKAGYPTLREIGADAVKALDEIPRMAIADSADALKVIKSGLKPGWLLRLANSKGPGASWVAHLSGGIYNPKVLGALLGYRQLTQESGRTFMTQLRAMLERLRSQAFVEDVVPRFQGKLRVVEGDTERVIEVRVVKDSEWETMAREAAATPPGSEARQALRGVIKESEVREWGTIREHREFYDLTPAEKEWLDLYDRAMRDWAAVERLWGVDTTDITGSLDEIAGAVERGALSADDDLSVLNVGAEDRPGYVAHSIAFEDRPILGSYPRQTISPAKQPFQRARERIEDTDLFRYGTRWEFQQAFPGVKMLSSDEALVRRILAGTKAAADKWWKEAMRELAVTTEPKVGVHRHLVNLPFLNVVRPKGLPDIRYYFEREMANQVRAAWEMASGYTPGGIIRPLLMGTNLVKSVVLGMDASVGLGIQGYLLLTAMARNVIDAPALIARAVAAMPRLIASRRATEQFIAENLDDISFFQAHGAGYNISPIDYALRGATGAGRIPILGAGARAVDWIQDLNFHRALLIYKHILNKHRYTMLREMRDNPNFLILGKKIPAVSRLIRSTQRAIAGGAKLQSMTDDEIATAVTTVVNARLGGALREGLERGTMRAAVESLVDIAPTWARARISLLANATKVPSPEAYLALDMIGREILIGAMLSTSLSLLISGKLPEFRPWKSRWLNVVLPDGSSIPVIPSISIPRWAFRVSDSLAKFLIGPDRDPRDLLGDLAEATKALAYARRHPALAQLVDQTTGTDYLGNDISTLRERAIHLVQGMVPIWGQEAIEAGEQWKDKPLTALLRAGLQAVGAGYIPSNPWQSFFEAADEVAETAWEEGTLRPGLYKERPSWRDLERDDQIALLEANPELRELLGLAKESDRKRKLSPQDRFYEQLDLINANIRKELGIFPKLVQSGNLTAFAAFEKKRRELLASAAAAREQAAADAGIKPKEDEERLAAKATAEYYAIKPEDFQEEALRQLGVDIPVDWENLTVQEQAKYLKDVDLDTLDDLRWELFMRAQDKYLEGLPAAVKESVLSVERRYPTPPPEAPAEEVQIVQDIRALERRYLDARDARDAFYDMPMFAGLDKADDDRIVYWMREADKLYTRLKAQLGGVELTAERRARLRDAAYAELFQRAMSDKDRAAIVFAQTYAKSPQVVQDAMKNPDRIEWLFDHPDLWLFWPKQFRLSDADRARLAREHPEILAFLYRAE